MATLTDLVAKVRTELGDMPIQFTTTLVGDGTTKDFYLKVKPVEPAYLVVTSVSGSTSTTVGTTTAGIATTGPTSVLATTPLVAIKVGSSSSYLAQGPDFYVEADQGIIHFTTAPASGATITVSGTHYRYFSNKDIISYVNTAVLQHTSNRTDSYGREYTLALLPEIEVYPVALLAAIEALWALATDAAFDIDITAPDGVHIPRGQRFSQLSNIITARKYQYNELCAALNIGLWRIEMGTLRRVSRTTNKLVPIYMSQEIDDTSKPERVYIENNLKGRTPLPDNVASYDIVLTQGDTWETEFDFPLNFGTNYTITAQIRTYPESPTLVAQFTTEVLGTTVISGVTYTKVQFSLTSDQTDSFPLKSFWDAQIRSTDGSFNETYVRGLVFANKQVTTDANVSTATLTAPVYKASTPPTTATVGTLYNYTFLATGPDPIYNVQSGSLPTGLSLNPFTGVLSGTPTTTGIYNFVIRVHNSGLDYTTAQNTYPVSGLFTDVSRTITVS